MDNLNCTCRLMQGCGVQRKQVDILISKNQALQIYLKHHDKCIQVDIIISKNQALQI